MYYICTRKHALISRSVEQTNAFRKIQLFSCGCRFFKKIYELWMNYGFTACLMPVNHNYIMCTQVIIGIEISWKLAKEFLI